MQGITKDIQGTGKDGAEGFSEEISGGGSVSKYHQELKDKVLRDISHERNRQNDMWGLQRHDYGKWLAILTEEVGEVSQAMQGHLGLVSTKASDADNLYDELIHVAAVATAIAEQVKDYEDNSFLYQNQMKQVMFEDDYDG